jgi:CubicO group peptidase (beta-lactamase class C family)
MASRQPETGSHERQSGGQEVGCPQVTRGGHHSGAQGHGAAGWQVLTVRTTAALMVLLLVSAGTAVAASPGQRFAAIDRLVEESMQASGIPGVSIAVIDDFEVVYARGYGFAEPGRPVDTNTLFQAASLSKPVSAMVAAAASERGLIDLEADVAGMLTRWHLPPMPYEGPITLRMLFAHRAGTNVHGFPGYRLDEPLPDLPSILDGVREKNEPIRVVAEPGGPASYSGGGYVMAQLAIEDHTGLTWEELADTTVFESLGLDLSTYRILRASDRGRIAVGFRVDGTEVAGGGWHVYPEQAPASLWTTPTEYAAIVVDAMRSYQDGAGAVLDQATARLLLDPDYPVGFGVSREEGGIAIGPGGANEGYRCEFVAVPHLGDGVIVMTNSDAGEELDASVIHAVGGELGWPWAGWSTPLWMVLVAAGLASVVMLVGWRLIRRRRRTRLPGPS